MGLVVRARTAHEEKGTAGTESTFRKCCDRCGIHWSCSCVSGRPLGNRCAGWLPFWRWMAESLAKSLFPLARTGAPNECTELAQEHHFGFEWEQSLEGYQMLKTRGVFVLTRGATIMAQSINDNATTSSLQETQKQQKKQAKRESKLRLEVEQ